MLERQSKNPDRDSCWRWSKDLFDFGYKNGFIVVKESKNGKRIYTKTYQNATIGKNSNGYFIEITERTKPTSTLEFVENVYSNDNARKDLDKLFDEKTFAYPKPVNLLKKIISISTNTNDIILDFHAGSGTTAHAALDLNKEDGGSRKFILIEQMDYIQDITCKRVEKVIEKNAEGSFVYMELKKIDNFQHISQNDDEKINKIKMKLSVEMEYLPYSEIEDETYNIPLKEKEANHHFYGVDDE
ncbi:MAG: adenine-specific DNA-methyltransferase, partial [Campylobacterota bacterium]|nr:adenine-specific DNA-methyltransferase [Campylobacterota bacterium]